MLMLHRFVALSDDHLGIVSNTPSSYKPSQLGRLLLLCHLQPLQEP